MDNQTIRVSPILAPIVSLSEKTKWEKERDKEGMEEKTSCEKNDFEEVQIGESSI